MLFTNLETKSAQAELNTLIDDAASILYTDSKVQTIKSHIESAVSTSRLAMFKARLQIPEAKRFNAEISHDSLVKYIKDNFEEGDRTAAYQYANLTRRVVLLESLLTSKVKLRKVAMDTLRNAIKAELQCKQGSKPTMSQIIHGCPLKLNTIVFKDKSITKLNTSTEDRFIIDEVKLQFINELCELDLLDIQVSQHTHMMSIPTSIATLIDADLWKHMWQLQQLATSKTLLIDPPSIDHKRMVTTSSWYYRTPTLSSALQEYFTIQHNTKYVFVDNALDLIEEKYMEHIRKDDGSMPDNWKDWFYDRVEFLKDQIRASQANGGHYIHWKGDSVWRAYAQCEIGHFQTSKALRSLVRVSNIANPIKKDFRNNVVQMYALLTGTRDLSTYVGLVEEASRKEDLRLLVAKSLNDKLETTVFCKDNIKPLFMVWAYNAGKDRILDGVTKVESQVYGPDITKVDVPGLMELTGAINNEKNREIIWEAFESTVTELVPMIVILKALFKKLIKHNPLTETSWRLPDEAVAQYTSAHSVSKTLYWVDSTGKQRQHTHHIKVIEENVKSAGLLPRVIHSYDAYVARQLVIRARKLGITVIPNHDSFMFDKEHETTIDMIVEEIFIEILESNYLGDTLTELNKSGKSLALRDENNNYITDEGLKSKYGTLTVSDLHSSEPMDLEEI